MKHHFPVFLAMALAAPQAFAQTASPHDIGFIAFSSAGNGTGLCREFSCTPRNLDVATGDTLALGVFGGKGQPFVVAISPNSMPCIAIPGFANQFALNPSLLFPVAVGQLTPAINFCGTSQGIVTLVVPPALPPKTSGVFQALSAAPAGQMLAFSRPIKISLAQVQVGR